MTDLASILDGLRCAVCGAVDTLWLDLLHGLIECHACGQGALLDPGNDLDDPEGDR
ncbi:hypothetical protein GCM10010517_36210 [Streptosporangium fragile]|uniref:Uncharacterized protein n=1 Tax=Streptosporangium fragile TaxID=46186 RepID=A0ABN3VY53_9ACTN